MSSRPNKTTGLFLWGAAAVIVLGCGTQSNTGAEATKTWEDSSKQSGDDTSVVTDSSPLADDSKTETQDDSCLGIGDPCTTSAVCCSGSCELGSNGD